MTRRTQLWLPIWQRKHADGPLYAADGFENITEKQYSAMAQYWLDKLNISSTDDVLDIGCGAGAFLQHVKKYRSLSGIDYSAPAIERIKTILSGTFAVA